MKFPLEGKRILLRRLKKSDAEDIFLKANNKNLAAVTMLPYPYTKRTALDYITRTHRNFRTGKSYEFGIELKETKKIIGLMSLMDIDPKSKNAEIGYWLGEDYWRKGFGGESLEIALDFAFGELKLEKVWAKTRSKNTASRGLLEKMGFKQEGHLRRHFFDGNEYIDRVLYGILRDEYYNLRKN